MIFLTKIEYYLKYDDFMEKSETVIHKMEIFENKTGKKITNKGKANIINGQIRKKINNMNKAKGICDCESGVLCKHRQKYLIEVING